MGKPWENPQENGDLPSGKRLYDYGKSTIFNGMTHYQAMFNGYIKLQEGITSCRQVSPDSAYETISS